MKCKMSGRTMSSRIAAIVCMIAVNAFFMSCGFLSRTLAESIPPSGDKPRVHAAEESVLALPTETTKSVGVSICFIEGKPPSKVLMNMTDIPLIHVSVLDAVNKEVFNTSVWADMGILCYASHLRGPVMTELIFLTWGGMKGELKSFQIIGDDGTGQVRLLASEAIFHDNPDLTMMRPRMGDLSSQGFIMFMDGSNDQNSGEKKRRIEWDDKTSSFVAGRPY